MDNGPEFLAEALVDWCRLNGINASYIDPGSPWQNGYVESFNGHLRDELLTLEVFDSMWEMRTVLEDHRLEYNHYRPHSSLRYLTPIEFAQRWREQNQITSQKVETIYQSLFVQGRGSLRKELHSCLRTGRAMRRAKAYTKGAVGQGQLRDMVMISERPAEVADRAVPGHWEGDLIFGKKMTAIGTLVERHSRYVMLLKLPNGHSAE
jgi:IS30 family transposase